MFRYISGANGNSGDDALLSEDGGINVRALPEDVQAVFADIDANGDGVLDMEEFKTMLSTYAVLRRSNQEGSVSISTLPDKVQPALKVFDQDGDGTVDPKELMRAAEMYQASKKSQRRMRKFIIGLVLFVIALIGINSAMTFMMVELGKETKASPDGVMRVNAGGGQHGAVVKTAANGEPAPLTTALPDAAFEQLKQFQVDSPTGAHVSLAVQGWYRVPQPTAATGSVVKLITAAGFIILDGTDMTFEETLGTVFTEAGFTVGGRKLLGIYALVGLFNSIDDWAGLTDHEREPGFGLNDFTMSYGVRHLCNATEGAEEKACVDPYGIPHRGLVVVDGVHYIEVNTTIEMSVATMEAIETTFRPEFDSVIERYKSPDLHLKRQIKFDSNSGFGSKHYYCMDLIPELPATWNVTNAKKVDQVETNGQIIREFSISTSVTEIEHGFITDFDPNIPYTGTVEVKYFDNKATGRPLKFIMGPTEIIVHEYTEGPVEIPSPDDEYWDMSDTCLNMTAKDALTDFSLPTPVPKDPYAFDARRKITEWCEHYGGCDGGRGNTTSSIGSGRKLLGGGGSPRPAPAPAPSNVACSGANQCHADILGSSQTARNGVMSISLPPDDKGFPVTFTMESWTNGCGIKSLGLSGSCGSFDCSVTGTLNGKDVCCDNSKYCGPNGRLDGEISFDLMNFIKHKKIREMIEKAGFEGGVALQFGYAMPSNSRAGIATVTLIGWIQAEATISITDIVTGRRLLAEDIDETEDLLDDEGTKDQLGLPRGLRRLLEEEASGRQLLCSNPRSCRRKKKRANRAKRCIENGGCGFFDQMGNFFDEVGNMFDAASVTAAARLEVQGTATHDFNSKRTSFGASFTVDASLGPITLEYTKAIGS